MLYLTDPPHHMEEQATLTADSLPHLDHWQARVGSILTVTDGRGGYYRARLLDDRGAVHVFQSLPPHLEPTAPRLLCQALPDKERMVWIIQKAVELGATHIQPMLTDRSNHLVKPNGGQPSQDKSPIWQKTALNAARQCRRALLPPVLPPQSLPHLLSTTENHTLLCLDLLPHTLPLVQLAPTLTDKAVALLVGPEGGFSDAERHLMATHNVIGVSLGGRILRTETAALAALVLLTAWDGCSIHVG